MLKLSAIAVISIALFHSCSGNIHQDDKNNERYVTDDAELLNKALVFKSYEFSSIQPFLYFRSGFLTDSTTKTAILIRREMADSFKVVLLRQKNKKWQICDSVCLPGLNIVQFRVVLDDFNKDEMTDIYIQKSISNGLSVSRGYLSGIKTGQDGFDFIAYSPDSTLIKKQKF